MIATITSLTATLLLLMQAANVVIVVVAEVVSPSLSRQQYKFQLSRAGRLGIPHEAFALNYTNATLPVFALTLDIDFFTTLTEKQFMALKETYGTSWYPSVESSSQVLYAAGRQYTLIDFLPQAMQALSGKHFVQQKEVFSLPYFVKGKEQRQKDQTCLFLINCWGFAYNMLYYSRLPPAEGGGGGAKSGLFFSVASPTIAFDAFWDSQYFDHVQSSSENPALLTDFSARNANLQPGDLILIWHKNQGVEPFLDHVAIFIDDDLYYEKSGTGDDVPFRLNDFNGLSAAWPFSIGVFIVDWRRVKPDVVLRDPAVRFGLGNNDTINEIQSDWIGDLKTEVQLAFAISPSFDNNHEIDAQTYTWIKAVQPQLSLSAADDGRAVLPTSYFDPETYRISLPDNIYKT